MNYRLHHSGCDPPKLAGGSKLQQTQLSLCDRNSIHPLHLESNAALTVIGVPHWDHPAGDSTTKSELLNRQAHRCSLHRSPKSRRLYLRLNRRGTGSLPFGMKEKQAPARPAPARAPESPAPGPAASTLSLGGTWICQKQRTMFYHLAKKSTLVDKRERPIRLENT